MGTHNLLLRLADEVFLEVIAIDPDAEPPAHRRWFGLDDTDRVRSEWDAGRRLRAWVAQTDDIGTVLRSHADLLGEATPVSRGERTWRFTLRHDGELPAGGIAPPVIDWSPKSNPARDMPDQGIKLRSFDLFCSRLNRSELSRLTRSSVSTMPPWCTKVTGDSSLHRSTPRAGSGLFRSTSEPDAGAWVRTDQVKIRSPHDPSDWRSPTAPLEHRYLARSHFTRNRTVRGLLDCSRANG